MESVHFLPQHNVNVSVHLKVLSKLNCPLLVEQADCSEFEIDESLIVCNNNHILKCHHHYHFLGSYTNFIREQKLEEPLKQKLLSVLKQRRLEESNGDILIGIMSIAQWVSKDSTAAEKMKREHYCADDLKNILSIYNDTFCLESGK